MWVDVIYLFQISAKMSLVLIVTGRYDICSNCVHVCVVYIHYVAEHELLFVDVRVNFRSRPRLSSSLDILVSSLDFQM